MSATATAAADAKKTASTFGKDIRVPSNLGFATLISQDGQVASVIFDNLLAELGPAVKGATTTHNQTAVQTKVATINVPYATDQRSVPMTLDIRGFVDAQPGACVRLVACAGDKTKAVNLSTQEAKAVTLKGKSKTALCAERPGLRTGDFQDRIEFTVQTHAAKPVLQITLALIVEHDTDVADKGSALLAVDSLDLAIAKPGKAEFK